MTRRPLFALSLIVVATTLWLLQTPSWSRWLPYAVPLILMLMLAGILREAPLLCRGGAGVLIALVTMMSLQWSPPTRVIEPQPARLEGFVLESRPTPRGGWFAVAGELDLQAAPACACTVIVRSRGARPLPERGSTVIVTGTAAPPRRDPGWTSIEETWCRSRAATFLMQATAVHVLDPPGPPQQLVSGIRNVIRSALNRHLPPPAAATMQAMLLGDRAALEPDLREAAARTGTAHLFAVSGLHVGAILGMVLFVTGGSIRRWYHGVLAVCVVSLFVAVTGGEPPAIRALIMATAAGLGRLGERHVDGLNLLGVSVLIELCCWPTLIMRPSFLLSTSVTAGLLWLVPPMTRRLRSISTARWWRGVAPVLSVHLAAAASSAVPGAILFGSVSLIAPAVNVVVVPLMVLALLSTILTVLVGWAFPAAGSILAWTPTMLVSAAEHVITAVSAAQPNIADAALPLVSMAFTISIVWQLRSTTIRGALTRLILGAACVLVLVHQPERPAYGVAARRIGWLVQVRVAGPTGERRFDLGLRYGRPFVRSYDDPHSSHRRP